MADSNRMGLADRVLPSLTFDQTHVSFILGHSLRSLYQELLDRPLPDNLRAIVDQLEARYPSAHS